MLQKSASSLRSLQYEFKYAINKTSTASDKIRLGLSPTLISEMCVAIERSIVEWNYVYMVVVVVLSCVTSFLWAHLSSAEVGHAKYPPIIIIIKLVS